MRGRRLFNSIFKNEEEKGSGRPGRSESLVEKRNSCLLARYYYYVRYKRKTYDSIMELLQSEFFISKERISRIVLANIPVIKELKQKNASAYLLQSQWPQYKW